jgi:membrane-bound lytic murein transglycosylase D
MSEQNGKTTTAAVFALAALFSVTIVFAIGCGGKSGLSSPRLYGDRTQQSADGDSTATDSRNSASEKRQSDSRSEVSSAGGNVTSKDLQDTTPGLRERGRWNPNRLYNEANNNNILLYNAADIGDSASAVDDDIWRQFELAEEYHDMGVIANREAAWEEAQYYFEKALKILGALDVEVDSLATPEAHKYTTLLDNIVADYRVALRSLGHLTEDVSTSVLIERFGDLANNLRTDTMQVYAKDTGEATYDIPIVMNDRVKKSIVYFQTVARDAFAKYLSRSARYAPMMKRILAEYGLPQDLIYLCLVESGFNPRAYSWARAVGLWQFISSTGRLYGLKRNWWIDERRDPVKSTHAACQHLKDLYQEFGSWELAMAAYNGGPGRIRKTIERQKTIDFWKMRLKRQTMDYVPLIMAAAIIAKNPAKYGFDDIKYEPELVWDEVVIDRCLDLAIVAKELGCTLKELKDLNPELLRRFTPPNVKKYTLKIPAGTKEKFLLAYDSMPSPKETSWVRHKIKRGETVSSIAAKYGVSQYAIFGANNLTRTSKIYAGKELIVPVPLDRDYSSSSRRKNRTYKAKNSIYTVRAGDTMWDIARAFGTTVDALRRINYIERGSRIYVGQKLKIPSSAARLKEKNVTDSRSSKAYAKADKSQSKKGKKSSGKTVKHKVRRGDTLWDIARKYGTTTAKIRRLNGLGRSSRIYPGQVLVVSDEGRPEYVIHKVRRGDTLTRIARQYRTSISRILAHNNIPDPDRLQVGKKLKIYLK